MTFNLIVYTSLEKEIADKLLEVIEAEKYIQKCFYRDVFISYKSTKILFLSNFFVFQTCFENKMSKKDPAKDLSGILSHSNASMNKTIFLDHSASATMDIKRKILFLKIMLFLFFFYDFSIFDHIFNFLLNLHL